MKYSVRAAAGTKYLALAPGHPSRLVTRHAWSTYVRLGRTVVGLEIRGLQQRQRDLLAPMVLLVLKSGDF